MINLPQSAELVEFECWFEHGLVESLVHLDQQGSHGRRRVELAHLKKQGNKLTLGPQEGRGESTVQGAHLLGVPPYIIALGVKYGHNVLYLWVVAGQQIL